MKFPKRERVGGAIVSIQCPGRPSPLGRSTYRPLACVAGFPTLNESLIKLSILKLTNISLNQAMIFLIS